MDRPEFETVDEVEKHRSSGGHARRAGVGDTDGEGEASRVRGGEGIGESSLVIEGVGRSAMVGRKQRK